jgi:hypothetical protein
MILSTLPSWVVPVCIVLNTVMAYFIGWQRGFDYAKEKRAFPPIAER